LLVNESAFHPKDKAVSKVRKAIPEAMKRPPFDAEVWFARLDELGGRDFLPNGISDEQPAEPDPRIFFDE
jgi:antitoxin VapB